MYTGGRDAVGAQFRVDMVHECPGTYQAPVGDQCLDAPCICAFPCFNLILFLTLPRCSSLKGT